MDLLHPARFRVARDDQREHPERLIQNLGFNRATSKRRFAAIPCGEPRCAHPRPLPTPILIALRIRTTWRAGRGTLPSVRVRGLTIKPCNDTIVHCMNSIGSISTLAGWLTSFDPRHPAVAFCWVSAVDPKSAVNRVFIAQRTMEFHGAVCRH